MMRVPWGVLALINFLSILSHIIFTAGDTFGIIISYGALLICALKWMREQEKKDE